MSALSKLLRLANPGLSSRELASRARKAGERIGHDTIARYERGDHTQWPSDDVIRALAAAYQIPEDELRSAASVPTPVHRELPEEAAFLTERQWRAVEELIRSMTAPEGRRVRGAIDVSSGSDVPTTRAGSPRARRE